MSIPIFPLLLEELEKRKAESRKQRAEIEGYVFPEQAKIYRQYADGITRRVQKVLARAGFRDNEEQEREERGAGSAEPQAGTLPRRGGMHVERKQGLRRASVRDFHSFRVTWVTLALTAGVPLELVQKVTGHKTTDIVLKHYFQPGREAFREALQKAMPALLTNGSAERGAGSAEQKLKAESREQKSEDGGQRAEVSKRDAQMRKIINGMTARTLKRDKERLLQMLKC